MNRFERGLLRCCSSAAVITVMSVSCGGADGVGPSDPDPGPVFVHLTTPNADDGILLFTVSGGSVSAVTSTGLESSASGIGTSELRLLVRGNLSGGPLLQLELPDRRHLQNYRVQVLQVASRGTYIQRGVQGYGLRLARP